MAEIKNLKQRLTRQLASRGVKGAEKMDYKFSLKTNKATKK